jgi:chromosome segregation ATPase
MKRLSKELKSKHRLNQICRKRDGMTFNQLTHKDQVDNFFELLIQLESQLKERDKQLEDYKKDVEDWKLHYDALKSQLEEENERWAKAFNGVNEIYHDVCKQREDLQSQLKERDKLIQKLNIESLSYIEQLKQKDDLIERLNNKANIFEKILIDNKLIEGT